MTSEQKAVYVYAQTTAALITAMGMLAENTERERNGQAPAYPVESFFDLPQEYGLDHNSLYSYLKE